MNRHRMTLHWEGTFIELCMGRIRRADKARYDSLRSDSTVDVRSLWYDNTHLLKSIFEADNWWSVNDLDHTMGLTFGSRSELEAQLAAIAIQIDGSPVTVDPEALQLSFYTAEAFESLEEDELVVCHGTRRRAVLHLQADLEPPFDPSSITLSFLQYPDYGSILIDLDVDGHDEIGFAWKEEATYLTPEFFEKDYFDGASGEAQK